MVIYLIPILVILILVIQYQLHDKKQRKILIDGSTVIQSQSGQIEYKIVGDGVPVLISHGGAGGYDQGLITANTHLDDRYKVISSSRFGHLRTPLPEQASAEKQATAYKDLLDELNIKSAAIIGTSGGGPSALQFALKYPERCDALILTCAVSQYLPARSLEGYKHPFVYWLLCTYFKSFVLTKIGVSKEQYKNLTSPEKASLSKLFETMTPIKLRRDGLMVEVTEWADKKKWSENYKLSDIKVPTLIIHAEDDAVVPYKHAIDSHSEIKNSTLLTLKSGGHLKLGHGLMLKNKTSEFIIKSNK